MLSEVSVGNSNSMKALILDISDFNSIILNSSTEL